jgi:hypothetical protein
VRVSDLILALAPASDRAPLDPIVDGIAGGPMTAYLELYAAPGAELRDVQVRIEITGEGVNAPVLVSVPATMRSAAAGWATARAQLSATTLAPGRYVARAEVSAAGASVVRVTRPFAILR